MPGGRGNIKPEDGKPFVKGDSRCHRTGRPKKLPELDRLLKDVLGEKVNGVTSMEWILRSLRKSAINNGNTQAAIILMDRAYGKLKETSDIKLDFDKMTERQLDELIARILQTKKQ